MRSFLRAAWLRVPVAVICLFSALTPDGLRPAFAQTPPPSPDLTSSPAGTDVAAPGGLYAVESKITFNVLDNVYYDAGSGELALIGHYDDRFKGAGIPYLQYLATLLDCPNPEFSLQWTPDSSRQVDSLLARELTQQESDDQATRLGTWFDSTGLITHTGSLMLPALGMYPINDNRAPGDLGVTVQSINGGRVVIMTVKPGCAADKAGLEPSDFIDSVRPDRPVFFASEFERQIRFAGAGTQIQVTYERGGVLHTTYATLDAAANSDPWYEINRYDLLGMMYRGAGDPSAAAVVEAMGIANTVSVQKEQTGSFAAYTLLMQSLDMTADFQHLQAVGANSAPPYDDSYNFGLKMCQQLDSIFHFAGNPLQNLFKSVVQQSHDPGSGITQALNEFDQQLKPKVGDLIDGLIFRPGVGFQIPPELVEDEYHIHPEMIPTYLGVPADSRLARLMLSSDYLCKQLENRQDLKARIPGYQTLVEYQINHPGTSIPPTSAHRLWISVAGVDAVQSTDGRLLALRNAHMRFNIRETDNQEKDLSNQQPSGYDDVLTGLYDQFEQDFPTLHELREAAKLAAVAAWLRKQNPTVRLPTDGRGSWKGPDQVDGLVYFYLTVNLKQESKIIKMAEGGVSLVLPAAVYPVDASVTDPRGNSAMADIFTKPNDSTVRDASTGAASPFVAGWVAPVSSGTSGQQAVVLVAALPNAPDNGAIAVAVPAGANNSVPVPSNVIADAQALVQQQGKITADNVRQPVDDYAKTLTAGPQTPGLAFVDPTAQASRQEPHSDIVQAPSSISFRDASGDPIFADRPVEVGNQVLKIEVQDPTKDAHNPLVIPPGQPAPAVDLMKAAIAGARAFPDDCSGSVQTALQLLSIDDNGFKDKTALEQFNYLKNHPDQFQAVSLDDVRSGKTDVQSLANQGYVIIAAAPPPHDNPKVTSGHVALVVPNWDWNMQIAAQDERNHLDLPLLAGGAEPVKSEKTYSESEGLLTSNAGPAYSEGTLATNVVFRLHRTMPDPNNPKKQVANPNYSPPTFFIVKKPAEN